MTAMTSRDVQSSVYSNRDFKEELGALVDTLCFEAAEKILNLLAAVTLDENLPSEGENGVGPPTETDILLYQTSPPDSECLLVPWQSCANGVNKSGATEAPDEAVTRTLRNSSSAPPDFDISDHDYVRPLPSPADSGTAVALNRKCHGGRLKKDTIPASVEATGSYHQCGACRKLFPSAERLKDHDQKAHPACSLCGAVLSGVLKLREHEIKEHGLLPYSCDYCPKRFNHRAHRELHVRARHTGEKLCRCELCGKGYASVSALRAHSVTHSGKTFMCDVCGRSFYHACHLTRHKLAHQKARRYQCATCGKGFIQAEHLRTHQAVHTRERQLCSVCGKSYRCLRNHVISKHSHELPAAELPARRSVIACDICGKKFPNASQCKTHRRRHTDEKLFHCDICGRSYREEGTLRDHRYTHAGQKPYRCSVCDKTFSLSASFMRHRGVHSGQTAYGCRRCGKRFRLLAFLKAHLQTKAHHKKVQGSAAPPAESTEP